MKPTFKNTLGVLVLGLLAQQAGAADNGQGRDDPLPVVVGTGSLTIAGEGYWYREDYGSGERPSLSAFDNNGAVLPDGVYRYEFRSFPGDADASHRQQSLARAEGEGISRRRGKAKGVETVSGVFEVRGGIIQP